MDFQYKLKSTCKLFVTTTTSGTTVFNGWTKFDRSKSRPGKWKLNDNGAVECTSDDHLMSGYINSANTKTDYRFGITFTLPTVIGEFVGLVFRYTDISSPYYYLAWDGGGNNFPRSLKLYKYYGGKLLSLVEVDPSAPWPVHTTHRLDAQILGNRIMIIKDGILILDFTDKSNPITTGTYGFTCEGTSVVISSVNEGNLLDVNLEITLDSDIDYTNKNLNTAKLLNSSKVSALMSASITEYTTRNRAAKSDMTILYYEVVSLNPNIYVFMNKNTPVIKSESSEDLIYGYLTNVPDAPKDPTELTVSLLNGQIIWLWKDNATNEDGYQMFNSDTGAMVQTFPAGTREFREDVVAQGTITRNVAAYNIGGMSAHSNDASITLVLIPKGPTKLTVELVDNHIVWTWVDNADDETGYTLFDENGVEIATMTSNMTEYREIAVEGVFTRNVAAFNKYGFSSHSNNATITVKFDPPPPPPEPPKPEFNVHVPLEIVDFNVVINPKNRSLLIYWKPNKDIADTTSDKWSPDTYRIYDAGDKLLTETTNTYYKSSVYVPGNIIDWTLHGYNIAGESDPTELMISFPEDDEIIDFPRTPSNLAGSISGFDITLRWDYPSDEDINAFNIYNDTGDIIDIAKAGDRVIDLKVTDYDRLYTFYITAVRGVYESNWSNTVDLKTDPRPVIIITPPVEPDNYPAKIEPFELEGTDTYKAFKSGIGDGLDLLVNVDAAADPNELFTYDVQLKGYRKSIIQAYPKRTFNFKFTAVGNEHRLIYTGDLTGILRMYPKENLDFDINAKAFYPLQVNATLTATFKPYTQTPIDFNYTITANCQGNVKTGFTNDKFDKTLGPGGPAIFGQTGGAGFVFDNVNNYIKTTRNGSSDLYWPSICEAYTNLDLKCNFMVDKAADSDDDLIGIAFRIKDKFNYYALQWNNKGYTEFDFNKHHLQLWKVVNNVPSLVYAFPNSVGWTWNVWYPFRLQLNGNNFTITLNNITYTCSDPNSTFMEGSFGPWAMSQGGAIWKDWTVDNVKYFTTSKTLTNSITDVNNSVPTNKQLTSDPLNSIMNSDIESKRIAEGFAVTDWIVLNYGIQSNTSGVTVYSNNNTTGGDVARGYTSLSTLTLGTVDDTVSKGPDPYIISDDNSMLLTNTPVSTIMQSTIEAYRVSKGYTSIGSITYTASTTSPDTSVNIINNTSLYGQNSTVSYSGSKNYKNSIFSDHEEISIDTINGITLTNSLGEVYLGTEASISYSIQRNDASRSLIRLNGLNILAKGSNTYTDISLSDSVDGKNPVYRYIQEVGAPAGIEAHCVLIKTGGDSNTYYYWDDGSDVHADGAYTPMTLFSTVQFATGANPKEIILPWSGETDWLEGTLNGKLPLLKNGDGLRNFIIPILMDIIDNVTEIVYTVEKNDPDVKLTIFEEIGNTTSIPGNIATFSYNTMSPVTIMIPWYGVKNTSAIYKVNSLEPKRISDKYVSPKGEGSIKNDITWDSGITDYCLVITSNNPNVSVKLIRIPDDYVTSEDFIDIELIAEIVNPTQTGWSPMIHNGYYYLNQAENFLYSEPIVRGRPESENVIRTIDFSYTLIGIAERVYPAMDVGIFDNILNDFVLGTQTNLIIGNDLRLAGNTPGSYTSSEHILNHQPDVVDPIVIDSICNDGSSVDIYYMNKFGEWCSINSTEVPGDVGINIRYKINLNPGSRQETYDSEYLVSASNMTGGINTSNASGSLEILNTDLLEGTYTSQPINLGTQITSLGGLTLNYNNNGGIVDVYTVTSNSPDGPWDGTSEPLVPCTGIIMSVIKQYLCFVLKLKSSKKDGVITPSVTINSQTPYITSPVINAGHVVQWNTFTVDAIMPFAGGDINVSTRSAHTESELSLASSLGSSNNTIMSEPNPFLVFDLSLIPGRSADYDKYISQPVDTDFQSSPLGTNVTSNVVSKTITLTNPKLDGEYQSKVIDFTRDIVSFYPIELNQGQDDNIQIETQSSSDGVIWSPRIPLTSTYDIQSPEYRYLRYFAKMSHIETDASTTYSETNLSYGALMDNVSTDDISISLIDVSRVGYLISGVKDLGVDVHSFDEITYSKTLTIDEPFISLQSPMGTMENPEVLTDPLDHILHFSYKYSGRDIIKLYTTTSDDIGGPWPEWDLVTNNTIVSSPKRYIKFLIEMESPSELQGLVVGNININYKVINFSSPTLSSIKMGAVVHDEVYPYVKSIKLNGVDSYTNISPLVQSVKLVPKLYNILSVTPIVNSIQWGVYINTYSLEERFNVKEMAHLAADTNYYRINDLTAAEIIQNYISLNQIDTTNLNITGYSYNCGVYGVNIVIDPVTYVITAQTTDTSIDEVMQQVRIRVEDWLAQITPIPQQGCPIVVTNVLGDPMTHVNFLDEFNNVTLTNTEILIYSNSQVIPLGHRDIDPDSILLTIDDAPIDGYVLDSTLYLGHEYDPGTRITLKYNVLNSFIVDYNYDLEDDYALISFYSPILDDTGEIKVRAEVSKDSAYYVATELNLNPLKNPMNTGFIYLVDDILPSVKLDVTFNPNMINANGYDKLTINVVSLDKFGNPVVDDEIKFSLKQNGSPVNLLASNYATTNQYGCATTILMSNTTPSDLALEVTNLSSGVIGNYIIHQRLDVGKHKLSLNQVGNKITATLILETQEPGSAIPIIFSSEPVTGTEFSLSKTLGMINAVGEDSTILSGDGIAKVTATIESLGLVESILSEVKPVV